MSLLIIHLMPYSTNHHSKWIQLYYGYDLLIDFLYLCLFFPVHILHSFYCLMSFLPCVSSLLLSSPHLSDVTQASVVQPVSWPRRPSQPSCRRVSPAHASPPTTASPHFAGLRSALAAGCWPAARPWSSTGTAGDTWSPLRLTVPRPGNETADTAQDRDGKNWKKLIFWTLGILLVRMCTCTGACTQAD